MKNYGCLHALFDVFMIFITGGLWLIWIIVKYLRTHQERIRIMTNKLELPPNVGKREKLRKDGTYGYVCNACGYPVEDHDWYCSECGAKVAGTLFYYGVDIND